MVLCLLAFTSLFCKYKYLVKASAQWRAVSADAAFQTCAQQKSVYTAEDADHHSGASFFTHL